MKTIQFAPLVLLLALASVPAAESQQTKFVSVVMLSATSCSVSKKEVACSDLAAYLRDALHASAETRIFVSGTPAQTTPVLVRELVGNLKKSGFANTGLAGFITE